MTQSDWFRMALATLAAVSVAKMVIVGVHIGCAVLRRSQDADRLVTDAEFNRVANEVASRISAEELL